MRATLALVLLLVVPLAGAHLSGLSQGTIIQAGPYSIAFSPSPGSPYVNDTIGLTAQVSEVANGFRARDIAVAANVTWPGGGRQTVRLVDDGTGYLVGSLKAPVAGTYSVSLEVRNVSSQGVYSGTASIDVYPELGFRIRSIDPDLDIVAGRTTTLAFETVDPITLRRVAKFDDLVITIEHWTTDHKTLLGSVDVPTENASPGLFKVDHVFESGDSYLLRFSSRSAGFMPADAPKIHVDATKPIEPTRNESPNPVLLVAVALLGAARLRRR